MQKLQPTWGQWLRLVALIAMVTVITTGCLYPGGDEAQTSIAPGEYIVLVENAIKTYKERTGVLPIINSSEDTPIMEKYRIDFKQLLDYNLLSRIPPDAFEQGGYYYYLIIHPEGELKVKLMDLRVSQAVSDVQRLVDDYRLREGVLPIGKPAGERIYVLDFEKLGKKQEQARSVFSGQYLVYLIHESGKVAIDYGPDIMRAFGNGGETRPRPDEDYRYRLAEASPYIPVASYPYYWINSVPVVADRK